MTASNRRASDLFSIATAQEHTPPGRTAPASVPGNDNHAPEVYWEALIRPPLEAAPPDLEFTETKPRRFSLEGAAYGLAGATALFVAIGCILVH